LWGDKLNLGNGFSYIKNDPMNHVDPFGMYALNTDGIPADESALTSHDIPDCPWWITFFACATCASTRAPPSCALCLACMAVLVGKHLPPIDLDPGKWIPTLPSPRISPGSRAPKPPDPNEGDDPNCPCNPLCPEYDEVDCGHV
jgi:hypothetical protein